MESIVEEKIKKILSVSYFEKDKDEAGDAWQSNVMRRIRYSKARSREESGMDFCNWFVWRFSAVALVLIIMLSVYAIQSDFQTGYELSYLFSPDSFAIGML